MSLIEAIFFFFNDTATTEIYTLSLHDALPNLPTHRIRRLRRVIAVFPRRFAPRRALARRSEEHTSELPSRRDLVCRLLLEKKKIIAWPFTPISIDHFYELF